MSTHEPAPPCSHEHPKHTHTLVSDRVLARSAALFKAMGDAARLRLLELLLQGRHCVTELAEETGVGMSTVSERLRKLHAGRLVRRQRDGKHIFYELADDHVVGLLQNALAHAAHETENERQP